MGIYNSNFLIFFFSKVSSAILIEYSFNLTTIGGKQSMFSLHIMSKEIIDKPYTNEVQFFLTL